MEAQVLERVTISGFKWHSGKVRDSVVVDKNLGLMAFVTTDRVSVFDVVLPTLIPQKGVILNLLSNFWKAQLANIIPSDLVSTDVRQCLPYLGLNPHSEWLPVLADRTVLVRMAEVVPVECIVRGYISGSCWSEYKKVRGTSSTVSRVSVLGHALPGSLRESDMLECPIFTPTTKEKNGHDKPLLYEEMVGHLGLWLRENPRIKTTPELLAQTLRSTSIALYQQASKYALGKGVIVADTKFEFGFVGPELVLVDEVLTPDSSRFWSSKDYAPGKSQASFDKQPVRDWTEETGWNKEPPGPALPAGVVQATVERYQEVKTRFIFPNGF